MESPSGILAFDALIAREMPYNAVFFVFLSSVSGTNPEVSLPGCRVLAAAQMCGGISTASPKGDQYKVFLS